MQVKELLYNADSLRRVVMEVGNLRPFATIDGYYFDTKAAQSEHQLWELLLVPMDFPDIEVQPVFHQAMKAGLKVDGSEEGEVSGQHPAAVKSLS